MAQSPDVNRPPAERTNNTSPRNAAHENVATPDGGLVPSVWCGDILVCGVSGDVFFVRAGGLGMSGTYLDFGVWGPGVWGGIFSGLGSCLAAQRGVRQRTVDPCCPKRKGPRRWHTRQTSTDPQENAQTTHHRATPHTRKMSPH